MANKTHVEVPDPNFSELEVLEEQVIIRYGHISFECDPPNKPFIHDPENPEISEEAHLIEGMIDSLYYSDEL